jgi:hypothetical protein
LAACVKTILLLNEPSIIEVVISSPIVFEKVCSALEYDPDLRDKANHRWFIRERAKFRTVVHMEDDELIENIHRAFRVTYLRDTLLRPTMDENSLSTLSSLMTFTHADIVKGVMCVVPSRQILGESIEAAAAAAAANLKKESYLVRVLRMLGHEVGALRAMEWQNLEHSLNGAQSVGSKLMAKDISSDHWSVSETSSALHVTEQKEAVADGISSTPTTIIGEQEASSSGVKESSAPSATWKQHLAPQDSSLKARKFRRRGCLFFLRELFSMVRMSLQQSDKDDFYAMIVFMDVELENGADTAIVMEDSKDYSDISSISEMDAKQQNQQKERPTPEPKRNNNMVSLLSLLGAILSDPNTDVSERGASLEIISGIAMHDPSHIRRHCLHQLASLQEEHETRARLLRGRPNPNDRGQVRCFVDQFKTFILLIFVYLYVYLQSFLIQCSLILANDKLFDSL